MLWIILLTIVTYLRTLFNKFISDDISVNAECAKRNYAIRWSEARYNPNTILHDAIWRLCKENMLLNHLITLLFFLGLTCSVYVVLCKFFSQNISFLATLFFIVHPCNAQVGGWISGKWYGWTLLLGLWALYFNNVGLYLFSALISCNILFMPIFMDIHWSLKILAMVMYVYINFRILGGKTELVKSEGKFKGEHLQIYPRKLIVAVKSFAYYTCLAMFPLKLGWFHTIGEPIDDKLKSFNTHCTLAIILVITLLAFWGNPAFIGILIFVLGIAPFSNIITYALFTSERYMAPALIGYSIFLAYLTINYPIVATVIIVAYFLRTQLELLAYDNDFSLALYSLLNHPTSGFAWVNIAQIFASQGRMSGSFEVLMETQRRIPEFPTTYWQLFLMYANKGLLANPAEAEKNLAKACKYGKHDVWYNELNNLRGLLKSERIKRFKESLNDRGYKLTK